jgi:tubby-related protein 1
MATKMRQQREKMLEKQRARSMMVGAPQSIPSSSGLGAACVMQSGEEPRDLFSISRASTAESSSVGGPLQHVAQSMGALDSPSKTDLRRASTNSGNDEEEEDGTAIAVAPESAEQDPQNVVNLLEKMGISGSYDPAPQHQRVAAKGIVDLALLKEPELIDFLLSPVPKAMGTVECRIARDKSGLNMMWPKYTLMTEQGCFLCSAKKRTKNKTSNYCLTRNRAAKFDKDDEAYIAKLRGNFVGSEFVLYGRGLNPKKLEKNWDAGRAVAEVRPELAAITYSSTVWSKKPRGPRKMQVILPHVGKLGEVVESRPLVEEGNLLPLARSVPETDQGVQAAPPFPGKADVYENKAPKWNDQIGAFVLNFNKRVTAASVKNFQLVSANDPDIVHLQFGRAGKETFTMDVRYPLSIAQAFGIVLSSFDYKLCCE